MTNAQQVVHDLETLLALREVDSGDVHDTLELALRVVSEEDQDGPDSGRRDVKRELVLEHGELLDELGQALDEVRAEFVQRLRRLGMTRYGRVGRRRLGERRRRGLCAEHKG